MGSLSAQGPKRPKRTSIGVFSSLTRQNWNASKTRKCNRNRERQREIPIFIFSDFSDLFPDVSIFRFVWMSPIFWICFDLQMFVHFSCFLSSFSICPDSSIFLDLWIFLDLSGFSYASRFVSCLHFSCTFLDFLVFGFSYFFLTEVYYLGF